MTESEAVEKLKHSIVSYEVQNRNNITCDFTREVLNMAINALEKQIPKKPVHDGCFDSNGMWHELNGINGRPYDLCPNCNTNLCCEMPYDNNPNYCSKCGCRLDWGDG